MAYYTGTDVKVWVCAESPDAGIDLSGTGSTLKVITSFTAGDVKIVPRGSHIGYTDFNIADITGVDLSTGAQDEEISYFGTKTPGKIETKSDMSVTITKKVRDRLFATLAQGNTITGNSVGSGGHGGKHGICKAIGGSSNLIHDGTIDPKSSLDDGGTIGYGYRVAIQLKEDSTGTAQDGAVVVLRNCSIGEYTHTVSADTANEESITFTSGVSPLILNGIKTGNVFDGGQEATAALDM
jgi:hypothetical protein